MGEITLEEKEALIHAILLLLTSSSSSPAPAPAPVDAATAAALKRDAFTALKILSRERKGLSELQSGTTIELLIQELVLSGGQQEQEKRGKGEVSREALKVLVNVLHGTDSSQVEFERQGGVEKGLGSLSTTTETTTMDTFLLSRILFLATATHPDVAQRARQSYNALDILVNVGRSLLKRNPASDPQAAMALEEFFRFSFVLWKPTDPASSTSTSTSEDSSLQDKSYAVLFPLLVSVLTAGTFPPGSPFYSAQLEAVNLLLSAPPGTFNKFFKTKDPALVNSLVYFLTSQLSASDPSTLVFSFSFFFFFPHFPSCSILSLSPLCSVVELCFPLVASMTQIAAEEKFARRLMKAAILPVEMQAKPPFSPFPLSPCQVSHIPCSAPPP